MKENEGEANYDDPADILLTTMNIEFYMMINMKLAYRMVAIKS